MNEMNICNIYLVFNIHNVLVVNAWNICLVFQIQDGNATLFVSRSQKRWRPSTVNSEVTEGSPTRNHDNTPTRVRF